MSSFMFFANEKRNSVKTEFPNLGNLTISKKLGEMWKQIPSDQKQVYKHMIQRLMFIRCMKKCQQMI
jgi:hypothetical protein